MHLKVGQPAMSHSPSTWRPLLKDDLFIRTGAAMEPTPCASASAVPIQRLLKQAQDTLLSNDGFDPVMECRTLRVGINGQFEAVLLPAMVRAFQQQVPGVRVIMRAISFPLRTLVTDTKLIAANTCGTA